jgi:hypothetical protein
MPLDVHLQQVLPRRRELFLPVPMGRLVLVVFGLLLAIWFISSSARHGSVEVFRRRHSIWSKDSSTDAYPVCRVNTCVSSFLRVAGTRVLLDSSVLSM